MIEIKNLKKSFDDKILFQDFNYTIPDKQMVAIVGKSGCGKTTLLNMIGLLDNEYIGEILFDSQNIALEKEKTRNEYIRNHINYLFQNYALIDTDNVMDNLLLALEYEKYTKEEKKQKINDILKLVGLENYQDKKVYTLSGGEQQRVALARVILKKGNIVLADEPTGNLDEENSNQVMEILRSLQKAGKTVILVTHNKELAKQCDCILELK